jgi:hypothetical protein
MAPQDLPAGNFPKCNGFPTRPLYLENRINPKFRTVGRKFGSAVLAAGMLLLGINVALANGKPV